MGRGMPDGSEFQMVAATKSRDIIHKILQDARSITLHTLFHRVLRPGRICDIYDFFAPYINVLTYLHGTTRWNPHPHTISYNCTPPATNRNNQEDSGELRWNTASENSQPADVHSRQTRRPNIRDRKSNPMSLTATSLQHDDR